MITSHPACHSRQNYDYFSRFPYGLPAFFHRGAAFRLLGVSNALSPLRVVRGTGNGRNRAESGANRTGV